MIRTSRARATPSAFVACLAALVAIVLAAPAAHAQPEMRGAYTPAEWDAGFISAAGAMIHTRVVSPTEAAPPGPVVLIMHGNVRTGAYHLELARTFASRGFVAIVPDMPCGLAGCDHDANARQISALVAWAIGESATATSEIAGRIDPERRALVGHSWGGLGTFLAAASDPAFDVWVGLDPEEDARAAFDAASSVDIPTAHLMAEVDGACNGNWGDDVYAATAAPHLRLTVASSGHCDPEEPTDGTCDFACLIGSRATTPLFRRYTIAFVSCVLGMDASMEDWIGGASFDGDVGAGRLESVMSAGLGAIDCGSMAMSPDAGIADGDGGASRDAGGDVDAGGAAGLDAAVGTDAGRSVDAGRARASDGGCACRIGHRDSSRTASLLLALVAMIIALRRPRARA